MFLLKFNKISLKVSDGEENLFHFDCIPIRDNKLWEELTTPQGFINRIQLILWVEERKDIILFDRNIPSWITELFSDIKYFNC